MPSNWNKGETKTTNLSVRKISDTMRLRKIDNFKIWRDGMKMEGKVKSEYPQLEKNGDLAELIGVVLGDGHICVYPRCEELRLISNSNSPGFIKRYAKIMEQVFSKKPYVISSGQSNSTKIGFYEKFISKRLGVPTGSRKDLEIKVPKWISKNREYVVRYLRGLYEAEGSFCVHEPTYTHKFLFANRNESMLNNVYELMQGLGFHPHRSKDQIQISKKEEVYGAMKVLGFRDYK
ncbi:MAG: LAGLIDADG family homing endonuclease [bacterium]|nr:LAGLIDADG family homing endonuclease [bacterium]